MERRVMARRSTAPWNPPATTLADSRSSREIIDAVRGDPLLSGRKPFTAGSRLPSWVRGRRIPLWIKILYSLFVCVLVPVYWRHYGAANFLWASDIALFFVLASLWSELPLPNSMMAVGVLLFEAFWLVDFSSGSRLLGMTGYMFRSDIPLYLRCLSLFHIPLPLIILFLLRRLGYDPRALAAETLLTWIVLPVSYLVSDPVENINAVFGLGRPPRTIVHPLLYLALEMILVPIVVYWPTHRVLRRMFGPR